MDIARKHTNSDDGDVKDFSLDPMLADHLETTLEGVYAYNADTAKYGVAFVWLARFVMIGAGAGAFISLLVGLVLVIGGEDIGFGAATIDPIRHVAWPLWFGAAFGLGVIGLFLFYINKAVTHSHRISMDLARRYRDARI